MALFALAACAVGAALRVTPVGEAFPWGDELHSLSLWQRGLGEIASTYDGRGSGLALPLPQHGLAGALGPTLWAVRGPAFLGGVGALLLVHPVARPLVGGSAAALATWALALHPVHVFYSHYGRSFALAVFLGLVLLRSAWLQHGKETRFGHPGPRPECAAIALDAPSAACDSGADLLVVHRDLPGEVRRHRNALLGRRWRAPAADRPFLTAFIATPPEPPVDVGPLATRLRAELGAPVHEDRRLLVWPLDAVRCAHGAP